MLQERPIATTAERFRLHTVNELLALEPPPWLLNGILPVGSLAVLYGPPATGKSFVALHWALSLATGMCAAAGAAPRNVAYVVGEGGGGVMKRVKAWMQHHQVADIGSAFFILEAAQLRDGADVYNLTARLTTLKDLALVVVDTVARCFVGGEENSSKDVGEFIAGVQRIQAATGAAVLLIHHTGKGENKDVERGSSALRGAADVMMVLDSDRSGAVTIKNNKQKDAEEFDTIRLSLERVPLGVDDATGRELTSCVVVPRDGTDSPSEEPERVAGRLLNALRQFPNQTARSGEWQKAAAIAETTYHRARRGLLASGQVLHDGTTYRLVA